MSSPTLSPRRSAPSSGSAASRLLVLAPAAGTSGLQSVVLAPGRYYLGSDGECDICVPNTGVAPRHCLIVVGPARSVVKALSPLTWLNDGVLHESPLQPGDRLIVGPIEWTVDAIDAEPKTAEVDEAHAQQLPWRDAAARSELSEAASDARADWRRRHQQGAHDSRPRREADEEVVQAAERLDARGTHLSAMAESLVARERELVAREADLRCQWDELIATRKSSEELDRVLRAEHQAVAAERQKLIAERQGVSAVRREMDDARADLGKQALALTEREHALQTRTEGADEAQALMSSRLSELEQRTAKLAATETAAKAKEAAATQRESAAEARERVLSETAARLDEREHQLAERERELEQRRQAASEQEDQLEKANKQHAGREDELNERAERLSEKEQQLASLVADAEQRSLEDATREERFADREHQLAEQEREVEARQQELREREQRLSQAEDKLAARENELEERASDCTRREEVLHGREQKLADDHAHWSERTRELEEREQRVSEREKRFESELQSATQNTREQHQLIQFQNELDERRSQLELRESALEQQQQELVRRTEELNGRESQLTRREADAAEGSRTHEQRDAELAGRAENLEHQTAELDRRAEELDARNAELSQRDEEAAERGRALDQRDRELAELAARLERRSAELDCREQSLSGQQRAGDESREQISFDQKAVLAREMELEAQAEQLQADRDALQHAQQELESRWGGIEREQAALQQERLTLERERVVFEAARDELDKLRTAQEADEAIWAKRRSLLDAREQELENRAEQLDRAASEMTERNQLGTHSPDRTMSLGPPAGGLVSHPDEEGWLAAAQALNQAASRELIDERAALDAAREQIDADRAELAEMRAEWDAQVAAEHQRKADVEAEQAQLQSEWEAIRETRAALEQEQEVFGEQRRELRRQLQEFAAMRGSAASEAPSEPQELECHDAVADVEVDGEIEFSAPPSEPPAAELEVPADTLEAWSQGGVETPSSEFGELSLSPELGGRAETHGNAATENPATDRTWQSAGATIEFPVRPIQPDSVGLHESSFGVADHGQSSTDGHTAEGATVEFSNQSFADERDVSDIMDEPQDAVHHWWPHQQPTQQDLISETGVYDAGAALAENSFDDAEPMPPEGPAAVEEEDDSVVALRARLAEMFGLSPAEISRSQLEASVGQVCASGTVDWKADTAESESEDDSIERSHDDEGCGPAQASIEDDGEQGEASVMDRPTVGAAEQHHSSSPTEEDSIAAYMQRLLARSRSSIQVPDDLSNSPKPTSTESPPAKPTESPLVGADFSPPAPKVLDPEVREAMRANLDSFRELANISARSAVAKHQSSKLQTVVQMKLIVLGIAAALTLILWVAGWFNNGAYLAYTTGAAIATIAMLAEVVRTMLAISRLKSLEAAGEYEAETTGHMSHEDIQVPAELLGVQAASDTPASCEVPNLGSENRDE